jgi:hypothetical protein
LEQVHVRGIVCRKRRLELVRGLGIALVLPALAIGAQSSQVVPAQELPAHGLSTQTTLHVETRDLGARTQAHLAVTVSGADGLPATGVVAIGDHGLSLAGAPLSAQGQASLVLDLAAGDHSLRATYIGDAAHQGSISQAAQVHALLTTTPDFQISVAPATLSLTAGQSGTVTASVTPVNAAALTAPMFVTLSCSGLPDESSCSFTPENLEILPTTTAAIASTMVIITQTASSASAKPPAHPHYNPVALAFLLPGALALGGLAWSSRRHSRLFRPSLLALIALVTMLGTTACNPRYDYEHHGPPQNPATPSGTYKVTVTAQSSNGIAATTHSTTLALTVQ